MNSPTHFELGRLLVIFGVILVVLGLIVMLGPRFSSWGLGRLPGDITIKGKHFQFYFPVVTCLLVSVVLSAVLWLISFLTKR
jgi:hypothetical protein